jgi:hypothetical protein
VYILKESPFYKLDNNLRRSNINFRLSDEEIEEIERIKDIVYFAEKYCRMDNEMSKLWGFPKLDLFEYQKEMLKEFSNNKMISIMTSRQMNKEWVMAIFILHYVINNTDKSVVISSINNSGNLLDKIKHLYSTLPFFVKPGLRNWNQKSVVFDNPLTLSIMTQPEIEEVVEEENLHENDDIYEEDDDDEFERIGLFRRGGRRGGMMRGGRRVYSTSRARDYEDDYERMLEREKEYEPYSEYGRGKAVRYVRY